MNAVALRQDELPGVPEPTSMVAMMYRAASDPSVDAEKMERIMAMIERLEDRQAKTAYYAAMSALQTELPEIVERGEIKISENKPGQKYALWEDINKVIKPILQTHGFALSFRTGQADGKITVTGVLSHKAGHSEETTIHLPSDTSGSKNAVQAVGSSTSYGKRYTASALLNLTTRGDDDDGRAAGGNGSISDEDMDWIKDMIEKSHSDLEKFCTVVMKVDSLSELTKKDMPKAREALNEALSYWQRKNPKAK